MLTCKRCRRATLHVHTRPSHWLHGILTVLTLGVWGVVWGALMIQAGRPRCTVCGKERGMFQVRR